MKNIMRVVLLFVSFFAVLQLAHAESFVVDRTHSAVGFSIRHLISTVHGRFTKFSGKIEYDSSDVTKFSIELVVQDSSINTDNERRDQHLRSQDFFWTDSFPTLMFKSTKAYQKDQQYYVDGELTMRGVTKSISVPFEVIGTMGSGDNKVLGLHATFVVNRMDYGIQWNNPLEAGGFVLGNDVTINIDIEAR
ncbi:MAG TPA: YceI family protein, partial [Saprospiraceae bacterium]|nr:YceI family protein [Saprospiraceae bacterium]